MRSSSNIHRAANRYLDQLTCNYMKRRSCFQRFIYVQIHIILLNLLDTLRQNTNKFSLGNGKRFDHNPIDVVEISNHNIR